MDDFYRFKFLGTPLTKWNLNGNFRFFLLHGIVVDILSLIYFTYFLHNLSFVHSRSFKFSMNVMKIRSLTITNCELP